MHESSDELVGAPHLLVGAKPREDHDAQPASLPGPHALDPAPVQGRAERFLALLEPSQERGRGDVRKDQSGLREPEEEHAREKGGHGHKREGRFPPKELALVVHRVADSCAATLRWAESKAQRAGYKQGKRHSQGDDAPGAAPREEEVKVDVIVPPDALQNKGAVVVEAGDADFARAAAKSRKELRTGGVTDVTLRAFGKFRIGRRIMQPGRNCA